MENGLRSPIDRPVAESLASIIEGHARKPSGDLDGQFIILMVALLIAVVGLAIVAWTT
ncbi:MAG TPA: hypothetical protein VJG64_04705 [Candidatus Paceibacterota bacterium]